MGRLRVEDHFEAELFELRERRERLLGETDAQLGLAVADERRLVGTRGLFLIAQPLDDRNDQRVQLLAKPLPPLLFSIGQCVRGVPDTHLSGGDLSGAARKIKVVGDDARDPHRPPRHERRGEARTLRRCHRRLLQQRVAADGARRDDAPRLVNDDLYRDRPLHVRGLRNRRVGGPRLRDNLAVQDAARDDRYRLRRGRRGWRW